MILRNFVYLLYLMSSHKSPNMSFCVKQRNRKFIPQMLIQKSILPCAISFSITRTEKSKVYTPNANSKEQITMYNIVFNHKLALFKGVSSFFFACETTKIDRDCGIFLFHQIQLSEKDIIIFRVTAK